MSHTDEVVMLRCMALFFCVLCSFACLAQVKATTDDGRRVILYPGGEWVYVPSADTAISGDCKGVVYNVDKMSGRATVSPEESIIVSEDNGDTGFGLFVMRSEKDKSISLSILVAGGGCVDEDAEIIFLFRDGTRLTLYGQNKFNCDSRVVVFFGSVFRKEKELSVLREKEIETLRIHTLDSYVQRDFSVNQSRQFREVLNCVINYKAQ